MNNLVFRFYTLLWAFQRADFYRDLADAFRRSVSLRDFIDREISNAVIVQQKVSLVIMRALARRLASGNATTLQDLMLGTAPASDQMLLAAVDYATKAKPEALEKAADAVEFQLKSLRGLAKELAIPLAAIPIVGAVCVLTAQIVVSIESSAPKGVWVGFNAFIRDLSAFILNYAPGIGIAIVGIIVALTRVMPGWIGPRRLQADKWPGFGLYRDFQAAVALSTMAMMISSGKTLVQCIEDMLPPASRWMRWQLTRILDSLQDNPSDYVAAFGRGLMPPHVRARMASLMDSSKSFDQVLIDLGTKEIDRLGGRVEQSAKALGGGLMGMLLGIAVTLSIGQMTIASAIDRESDPANVLKQKLQQQQQP
jgi:hypothetical protein